MLDGELHPFTDYPAYGSMAPCMRGCDDDYEWNVGLEGT
jgi:hypothetical protein